jgi:hypothetical protein
MHTQAHIGALSMAGMSGCDWRITSARGRAGASDESNDKVERQRTLNDYTASRIRV